METERLILREWRTSDIKPFAEINADPDVMKYFPSTLSKSETKSFVKKITSRFNDNGWGFWALELKATNEFIGFVGLNRPFFEDLPFYPCVEIGWRLSQKHWGNGYAPEAAQEILKFAFEELALQEVYAFTPVPNTQSQSVMRRINMSDTGQNFLHPAIPASNKLQEHVLFKVTKKEWESAV